MAIFLFFGEWGLKGKFEKIPKISVIFALFGVVGSERDFLKNAARRVGKNFSSPYKETTGRKATFQSLVSKKRAETAVSIALLMSRRIGIFPLCGTGDMDGSQTQRKASLS